MLGLTACGWGWFFGRSTLNSILERRQVEAAESFLRKGDLRNAVVSAREALHRNPDNAQALRVMASIAEAFPSPEAILWRQRLAELTPDDVTGFQNLALTAVKFDEIGMAQQALERIPSAARHTLAYHQTAAAVATAAKQNDLALEHFNKGLALAPQDTWLRFNVAALGLSSPDATQAAQARAELNRLRENPSMQLPVLRALLGDARKRQDGALAMRLATRIDQSPRAEITDHLLYLEELQRAKDPALAEKQIALGDRIRDNVQEACRFLLWMNAHGLASQSIDWYQNLDPILKKQMPLPLALAEACVMTGNWTVLSRAVSNAQWETLEFLRLAYQSRVLAELSHYQAESMIELKWDLALTSTAGRIHSLTVLARMAESWGWSSQAVKAWWFLARHKTQQTEALFNLNRLYAAEKNTLELCRVARRAYELQPDNPALANNLAYYELLLRQNLEQNAQAVAEHYRKIPGQPVIASTYALALHLQKKDSEALALLSPLPKTFLCQPAIAACYGVVLARTGNASKARKYLGIAANNRNALLPEEAALADSARPFAP